MSFIQDQKTLLQWDKYSCTIPPILVSALHLPAFEQSWAKDSLLKERGYLTSSMLQEHPSRMFSLSFRQLPATLELRVECFSFNLGFRDTNIFEKGLLSQQVLSQEFGVRHMNKCVHLLKLPDHDQSLIAKNIGHGGIIWPLDLKN